MVKLNTSAFKNVWTYKVMKHIDESNSDAFVSEEGLTYGEHVRVRGECDKKGRIIKIYHNYDSGRTDSQIFKYNEHGDIIQAIFDFRDDGDYEEITEYKCKYDKDKKLVSQTETVTLKKQYGLDGIEVLTTYLRFWSGVVSKFMRYYSIM